MPSPPPPCCCPQIPIVMTVLFCVRAATPCAPFPDPLLLPHTVSDCAAGALYSYPKRCSMSCQSGWSSGAGRTRTDYVCATDGSWSLAEPMVCNGALVTNPRAAERGLGAPSTLTECAVPPVSQTVAKTSWAGRTGQAIRVPPTPRRGGAARQTAHIAMLSLLMCWVKIPTMVAALHARRPVSTTTCW
jgi:hypothetical protein